MKRVLLFYIFLMSVILPTQINAANYGDIIMNEVMADPNGLTGLPQTEYVEIYNTTNTYISLKDWSFVYIISPSSSTIVTLPDSTLPPNGYAVLFRTGREIQVDDAGIKLPLSKFPANLANTGKDLQLKDPSDFIIDSVTYDNAESARSWERDADKTWYLSNDLRGGTPGSVNSPKDIPIPPVINPSDNSNPGDVIINEIMANPVGLTALPETEYVEIYNASDAAVPLHNWSFIYDEKAVTLPDTILPIGGYAVLYRTGRDITVENIGLALPITNFPASLANTGKTIGLKNSFGTEIDAVTYTAAKAARSWERDAANEWYLSTDPKGGTPGAVNSLKDIPIPPVINPSDDSNPGDVIINEIMANPAGLTELPETEYVEIYNASGVAVPLHNWSFVYDGKAVTLPDTILPIGGYAVLFRSGHDITVENIGLALPITNFPASLANTGKTIGLKNSFGTEMDAVTYTTAEAARSWERDAGNEWYLSTDPKGGTPGAVNSLKDLPIPPVINPSDNSNPGDVMINEIMANPVGLTELPETEYVEIYNASGAAVPLHNWSFVYDGKAVTLPDTILPIGGYAVLFRSGHDITLESTALALPINNFPASLANTGKTIELKNSFGTEIDVVTYTTAKAARSWERSAAGNEWYLSTDPKGGTPGAVNSQKDLPEQPTANPLDHSIPGDVIINEIMANPAGLTQLPETEYVEIYNASGATIPLHNWSFVYDGKAVTLPDTILPIGGYAVLFRSGHDISLENTALALPFNNFPASLANTGKTIGLKNSHNTVIDTVTYTTAKAARSWERDAADEWYLSTDPKGGTPGTVNSQKENTKPPIEPVEPVNPDSSGFGDMIINEVMANPTGLTQLPETEYVEIYNASGATIPLHNWSFVYDGKAVTLPDTLLSIGGYAVLFRSGHDVVLENTALALPINNFPANLANTGKTIGLKNSHNPVIDTVTYTTAKAARSWERDNEGNWYLSNDPKGGTPGAVNSSKDKESPNTNPENPDKTFMIYEKELILNEILPEPFAGGSEYVELYNRSERTLSFSNLSVAVRKPDGTISTHYSLNHIADSIVSGEYAVLTTNRNGVSDFYYIPAPEKIYELKMPALNNTGATLTLFRTHDEFVIDQISYSPKWHDSAIKNVKGVSLERIHPDIDTQSATNWTSATAMAGYGTPGYKNSQDGAIAGNEHTILLNTPEYRPELDEYIITYQTDQPGYRCRIEIFTIEGNRVAEISNNQLIGTSGEIRWDGIGSDGSHLRTGIYIFYGELYHPAGQKKTYKKPLLIR